LGLFFCYSYLRLLNLGRLARFKMFERTAVLFGELLDTPVVHLMAHLTEMNVVGGERPGWPNFIDEIDNF
jgi:hypothetical protein